MSELTDAEVYGKYADELMRFAASLEQASEHPLGQAIVRHALARGLRSAAKLQNLLPRPTDVPGAPREPASAPPLPPGAESPEDAPPASAPATQAPAKK